MSVGTSGLPSGRADSVPVPHAQSAYVNLRRALVTWRVEPGQWLNETTLQQLSGFGRTPTREAVTRLISDDLLYVVPRNGYQVADISVHDTAALFDVFENIGYMIGATATGRVDARTLALLRGLAAGEPLGTDVDPVDATAATIAVLFDGVIGATGNPWLARVSARLFPHLQRLWVLLMAIDPPPEDDNAPGSVNGAAFRTMLSALELGEPEAAGGLYQQFTNETRARTLDAVARYELRRSSRVS